jgi:hypothetical protein
LPSAGACASSTRHQGGEPVRREDQDDCVAARHLLVKPLLPQLASTDAGILVEIEKDTLEAEPRQCRLNVVGDLLIAARMTDENCRHDRS